MYVPFARRVFGGSRPAADEHDDAYAEEPSTPQAEFDQYQEPAVPSTYPIAGHDRLYKAEPQSFEDAGPIADCIKKGYPVVVNMEKADPAEAQRIRDFLRGAAYALGGDVRKVAGKVYACVPAGVQIQKLSTGEPAQVTYSEPAPGTAETSDERYAWPE